MPITSESIKKNQLKNPRMKLGFLIKKNELN